MRPAASRHLPVVRAGWEAVWVLSGSILTAVVRRMSRTWCQRSCGLADSMSAPIPAHTGGGVGGPTKVADVEERAHGDGRADLMGMVQCWLEAHLVGGRVDGGDLAALGAGGARGAEQDRLTRRQSGDRIDGDGIGNRGCRPGQVGQAVRMAG